MAAIERITSLADVPAIEKELQSIDGGLQGLLVTMTKVQNGIAAVNSAKGGTGLADATIKLSKAQEDLQKQTILAERAIRAKLQTDQAVIKVMQEEERQMQLQNKTQKQLNADKEKAQKIAAGDKKLIEQATNEYFQLNKALQDAEVRYKNLALTQGFANEQTRAALKEALAIRNTLDKVDSNLRNYQRNVGNYGSAFNGLGVSIQQILREAPSAAVSLNTFFLAISNNLPMLFDEITKTKKAIEETNKVIKEQAAAAKLAAEAEALQAGASKEAAIAQGLLAEKTALANMQQTKAPSLMKQITSSLFSLNTLLTVGVLALTLFGGKIVDWVSGLFKGEAAIKSLNSAHKEYMEVVSKASQSAQGEITSLRVLEKAATDVSKPMKVRLEAVKDLKDQYPKYLENLSNEAILNGQAAAQINLVADALIKKAFYQAAADKATDKASKNIDLKLRENFLDKERIKTENNLLQLRAKYNNLNIAERVTAATSKNATLDYLEKEEAHLEKINTLLTQNRNDQKFNADQIQYFTNLAAKNFDTVKKLEIDPKGKKAKDIKTVAEAMAELRAEMAAIQKNQDINIINIDQADEQRLQKIKSTIDEIYKLKDTDKNKQAAIVSLVPQIDAINLRVLERSIKQFSDSHKQDFKIELPVEIVPPQADDFVKAYEDDLARSLTILAKNKAEEEYIQATAYTKGEINRTDYEENILNIQKRYAKSVLQTSIDQLTSELKYAKLTADQRLKIEKDLAEAKAKLAADSTSKTIEQFQKFAEFANQAVGNVFSAIGSIQSIGLDKQKTAIDELEAKQQDAYTAEVERINNLNISDQQRADLLSSLEASRTAEKVSNERRIAQIELQRAKFEKAANIANIITSTALAVVNALKTGGPFAIPLSITIGALGAAQLARAIAVPLPRYAKGTDSAKRGLAWVGEEGTEAIEKNGRVTYTPNKPTLAWLEGGEKVTPHHKLSQRLGAAVMGPLYYRTASDGGAAAFSTSMSDAISVQTYRLERALRGSKRKVVVNNNINIDRINYLNKKVYNK